MAELSKYEQALAKYNCELDDQQVADAVLILPVGYRTLTRDEVVDILRESM